MKGLVTAGNENMLKVHIIRQEACGHCKACLSGYIKSDMDLDAKNLCDAEVGDWVELELQENAFMKAVLISYGIPFLGFMAGIFAGYFLLAPFLPISAGLTGFLLGMICVFLCYAWMKKQNPRWESGKFVPMAVKLAPEGYTGDEEQCETTK